MGVGAGLYTYDVVVKKFTFAVSSPNEFLFLLRYRIIYVRTSVWKWEIVPQNSQMWDRPWL